MRTYMSVAEFAAAAAAAFMCTAHCTALHMCTAAVVQRLLYYKNLVNGINDRSAAADGVTAVETLPQIGKEQSCTSQRSHVTDSNDANLSRAICCFC